jgi:hypothetical protein
MEVQQTEHGYTLEYRGRICWQLRCCTRRYMAPSSANDFIDPHSRNTVAEAPETCGNISATDPPQLLYMDNQSAMKIAMSSTSQVHERTKHIDIRHHFVRDASQKGRIRIKYLPTNKITADILTKALPRDAHQRHVKGMGLRSE